jgi:hypothetical protein
LRKEPVAFEALLEKVERRIRVNDTVSKAYSDIAREVVKVRCENGRHDEVKVSDFSHHHLLTPSNSQHR